MSGYSGFACFNELSVETSASDIDVFSTFEQYVRSIKSLKAHGFAGVKYSKGIACLQNADGINVFDLRANPRGRDVFKTILTTARNPYIEPGTQAEDRFIEEAFETSVGGEWIEGEGFSSAILLDSITISLDTHSKWHEILFPARRKGQDDIHTHIVNVSSPESCESDHLLKFVADRTPIELKSCQINPEDKHYSFRDDHGTDKLMAMWRRLRNCEYVISAINSLPFDSRSTDFVERCFEDGKIHIRLTDTEKGFGMVIQTTGKDLRSTQLIGDHIAKKYG